VGQHVRQRRAIEAREQVPPQVRRIDDEAEHGEVVDAARIVPEQAKKHLRPGMSAEPFGGDVDLLRRRIAAGERQHGSAQIGIALERAVAAEEQHLARRAPLGGRVPDDKAVDVGIGVQTGGIMPGDQVEAAITQLGVVDRGQRVEDRAVENTVQLCGDIRRRLLTELPLDDACLRLQRGNGAVLQEHDERSGREGRRDDDRHRGRAPREVSSSHGVFPGARYARRRRMSTGQAASAADLRDVSGFGLNR
jgi:hypothetical protein